MTNKDFCLLYKQLQNENDEIIKLHADNIFRVFTPSKCFPYPVVCSKIKESEFITLNEFLITFAYFDSHFRNHDTSK